MAPDAHNIPDPGVAIYEFTGAMGSGKSAGGFGCTTGGCPLKSDPVSLATGQFIYTKTDLALPDTIPVTFSRTYNTIDSFSRSFGVRLHRFL